MGKKADKKDAQKRSEKRMKEERKRARERAERQEEARIAGKRNHERRLEGERDAVARAVEQVRAQAAGVAAQVAGATGQKRVADASRAGEAVSAPEVVLAGRAAAVAAVPYAVPHPVEGRTVVGAWDLHNHSTFSDSSFTVDELIAAARAAGLSRIAITDHDATSQLSAIRARARELAFPVLAGLEVSSIDPATNRKVHILAFGIEAEPDGSGPLDRMVAHTLYQRTANTLWQAWVLKRLDAEFSGKRVSLDEVVATAGESTGVYKQHLMEAVTGRHHNDPDYQFFYRCQLKGGGPADHDITYPAAVDAVRAIREQGGVPVLAHPGQMDSWAAVPELVRAGLMGIEAYHPDHGPVEEALAFEAAAAHGLFVTGGSDFHGKYGSPQALGTSFVMPEEAGERVEELFRQEVTLS